MSAFSPEQWQEISPYLDHAMSLSERSALNGCRISERNDLTLPISSRSS